MGHPATVADRSAFRWRRPRRARDASSPPVYRPVPDHPSRRCRDVAAELHQQTAAAPAPAAHDHGQAGSVKYDTASNGAHSRTIEHEPQVGTLLNGRYRLDAQIGAGGMSTVYRAFDTTLERQVAIKLMHREIASDSDQLERFRREARAVAQLSHPHIVGVIDAGEDDGRPYIVFEYVEGETLKDRIRRMRPAAGRRGDRLRDRDRPRARRRARARHRPPRRQAPERPHRRGGLGQGHRLRHRPLARRGGPDRRRPRARHDRLRLARAGARPRRRRPVRHLLARRRALRDAHRRRPVPRREPGRRGDEARPRGPARRPGAPPGGLGRARRGARPHDRQGPRRAATPTRRRSIADLEDALAIEAARAGHARPARRPRSCARCPARARRRLPLRMRHPVALLAALAAHRRARSPRSLLPGRRPRRSAARGDAQRPERRRPAARRRVSLKRAARTTTTRSATTSEHSDAGQGASSTATRARRGRPRATTAASLGGKAGVGIYVDAKPTVAARAMQIQTPTKPGWKGDDLRAPRRARRRRRSTAGRSVGGGHRAPRRASASTLDTARQPLPLLPRLDHQAAARRRQGRDLRDPPVQVGRRERKAGGIRSDPARYDERHSHLAAQEAAGRPAGPGWPAPASPCRPAAGSGSW